MGIFVHVPGHTMGSSHVPNTISEIDITHCGRNRTMAQVVVSRRRSRKRGWVWGESRIDYRFCLAGCYLARLYIEQCTWRHFGSCPPTSRQAAVRIREESLMDVRFVSLLCTLMLTTSATTPLQRGGHRARYIDALIRNTCAY